MDEFLTVAEVAEILRVNPQTIRNWIDAGALPAVRVGQRRVRIRGEDLQTLLDRGQRSGRAAKPAFDAHGFWEGESLPGPQEP